MNGNATYLYAVTEETRLPASEGIAGAPLRLVGDGLRAVVSTVPLAEFDAEALRRNLEDLPWLERTARAHHRVVDALTAAGRTAPVRLCTVYRDDERVAELLEEQRAGFAAVLQRIGGRREWGVKMYGRTVLARQEPAVTGEEQRPGTAYLRRVQARQEERQRRAGDAEQRAADILTALDEFSVARRRYPMQDRRLSGHAGTMVLNAAFLLDRDREREFRERLAGFTTDGLTIELTGPWAPYSFAELEER